MKFFRSYIKRADTINRKTAAAVSWCTLILVLVICYDVFSRYLLKSGSVALQELEWHLFAIIFLAAAGNTLRTDDHVRVDIFYHKLSEKKKAWIDLLGVILFLIPFCIVVIITSFNFVKISFMLNETSPDAGGLPARYILKSFIPLSFFLIILQGVSLAFKSVITLRSGK